MNSIIGRYGLKMTCLLIAFWCINLNNAQQPYALVVNKVGVEQKDNSKDLSKSLIRKFKRDAARLALRIEGRKEDLRYQAIVIPKNNVENIYQLLSYIYQEDETAKAIAKCNVHTFPSPSIDRFKIIFNNQVDWAAPLQEGITETNSPQINQLLEDYNLVIDSHERWTETEDVIVLRSMEPMNMAALANEFYNVEGVVSIDLGIPDISGNDIEIKRLNDAWEVRYILKYGASYIRGNGKQHLWTYQVFDDGRVELLEESGDPIPAYMKCSDTYTTE